MMIIYWSSKISFCFINASIILVHPVVLPVKEDERIFVSVKLANDKCFVRSVWVSYVDGPAGLWLWVNLHYYCLHRLHTLQRGLSLFPTRTRYRPTDTNTHAHRCQFFSAADIVCLPSSRKRRLWGEKVKNTTHKKAEAEGHRQAGRADAVTNSRWSRTSGSPQHWQWTKGIFKSGQNLAAAARCKIAQLNFGHKRNLMSSRSIPALLNW